MYFQPLFSLRLLVCGAAMSAVTAQAQPASNIGQITQLSGIVTAQAAASSRKFRILAMRSLVNAGDTLRAEPDTYVRLSLPDGRVATLGPGARLSLKDSKTLELLSGSLEVRTPQNAIGSLSVVAGTSVVDVSKGSVLMQLMGDQTVRAELRQQAYARAALAWSPSGTLSDATEGGPVWEVAPPIVVAQNIRPTPGLAPGLYVQVIDGMINLSNNGGSQNFTAGQFGFTPSFSQPPVIVPRNPGLQFSPPPVFQVSPGTGSSGSSGSSSAVDCEVR